MSETDGAMSKTDGVMSEVDGAMSEVIFEEKQIKNGAKDFLCTVFLFFAF